MFVPSIFVIGTKGREINFEYFFNYMLNRKSCRQNQERAKSWGNQFLNTCLIEFWIETSCHQNQDRAKSWKNQFSNTFLNWNLNRNKLLPKPKSCQKQENKIFEYFFNLIFYKKQASTKTKIVPKAGKIIFWIFFSCATISHFEMFVPSIFVMGTKAGEINFEYSFN